MDTDSPRRDHVKRPGRYFWLLPLFLLFLVGIAGWWLAETPRDLDEISQAAPGLVAGRPVPNGSEPAQPSGTSGSQESARTASQDRRPIQVENAEQVLQGLDGENAIGRRLDLQATIFREGTPVKFWIGSPEDGLLLVIVRRDVRDGRQDQLAVPPVHSISPVEPGERVTISGRIQRVPPRELRYSWELTRPERAEIEKRNIYLEADRITAAGTAG